MAVAYKETKCLPWFYKKTSLFELLVPSVQMPNIKGEKTKPKCQNLISPSRVRSLPHSNQMQLWSRVLF